MSTLKKWAIDLGKAKTPDELLYLSGIQIGRIEGLKKMVEEAERIIEMRQTSPINLLSASDLLDAMRELLQEIE